jgi:hypothetical protein
MAASSGAPEALIEIPADQYEVARRYILAIIQRDRRASLDPGYAKRRTGELWDRFFLEYARVSTGYYARHDAEALRIALSRI